MTSAPARSSKATPPRAGLRTLLSSRRLRAVSLLSLSSGAPLGLVLVAVPAWMASAGVDIRTIGVLTLAQAPYAFKFLWSPLLDRFRPPLLHGKRGWILVWQLALALLVGALGLQAGGPEVAVVGVVTLLAAFASASQDIAIDGYAVEALEPAEQGAAVGARTALYRAAMYVAGNIAISAAGHVGWGPTLGLLAASFVALAPVTLRAPEPEAPPAPPRTLRAAVWEPFTGFLRQPRALEIAAFLVLYKVADNMATALIRPFLVQKGYSADDVGIGSGTIGLFGTLFGTFVGGLMTTAMGTGRALWVFGVVQAVAHVGYAWIAAVPVHRGIMYFAMGLESVVLGLGTAAFGVLLLRLTDRRFSATQYALLSSLFALGRTVAGPAAGFMAAALGWRDFFLLTIPCAVPGLVLLSRFVPWHARELPEIAPDSPGSAGPPVSVAGLAGRAFAGFAGTALAGEAASAGLAAATAAVQGGDARAAAIDAVLHPSAIGAATLLGFALIAGMGAAAYAAARRGVR